MEVERLILPMFYLSKLGEGNQMINAVDYLENLGFETVTTSEEKNTKKSLSLFLAASIGAGVLVAVWFVTPILLFRFMFM